MKQWDSMQLMQLFAVYTYSISYLLMSCPPATIALLYCPVISISHIHLFSIILTFLIPNRPVQYRSCCYLFPLSFNLPLSKCVFQQQGVCSHCVTLSKKTVLKLNEMKVVLKLHFAELSFKKWLDIPGLVPRWLCVPFIFPWESPDYCTQPTQPSESNWYYLWVSFITCW